MRKINPESISAPLGAYTHGISVPADRNCLYISGQVGADKGGNVPEDFEQQADLCWRNVVEVLKAADMGIDNLVKTTVFLTSAESLPIFARVRNGFLGDARPASSVVIVSALVRPQWQVEIEAVACG